MHFFNTFSSDTQDFTYNFLPNGDLEAGQFHDTYLKDIPLVSRFYEADNYETFIKIKLSETSLFWLPSLMASCVNIYNRENKDSQNFWENIDNLVIDKLDSQIKQLYKYKELMELLPGYKNTKEYLFCALVRNNSLWAQFVSQCMLDAAQKLFGLEASSTSELKILETIPFTNGHNEKKYHVLQYIEEVEKCIKEQNWAKNLHEFSDTTTILLEQVELILQRLGLAYQIFGR